MCMTKQYFQKKLTRDNSLMIQEVWDNGYMRGFQGVPNPFLPTQINYIKDGVVEIWDNIQAIQWFEDHMQSLYTKQPGIFFELMERYEVIAEDVATLGKKERFDSIDELRSFIDLLQKGTYGFLLFYHSVRDERTPQKIKTRALEMRNKDHFYDDADRLIKSTIEYIHPHTKGKSIVILTDEVDHPPVAEVIESRFDHCVHLVGQDIYLGTLQAFVATNPEYLCEIDTPQHDNKVTGRCAFPGRVIGNVCILKRKNDMHACLEGDILVAPETTPDFLPAMKKAAAIVTDEGGLLSHAAIVAREIKKPCVIGTEHATQVFRNGDVVEVDADSGVVRKL